MSLEKRSGSLIIWRIENFSFCYHEKDECIFSQYFLLSETNDVMWYLRFYPRRDNVTENHIISVDLACTEADLTQESEIIICYEVELKGPSGKILASVTEENKIISVDSCLKIPDLVHIDVAMQDIEAMNQDNVTVCCCIFGINSHKLKSAVFKVCTTIPVYRHFFRWKVPHGVSSNVSEYISAPDSAKFQVKLQGDIESSLRFFIYRRKAEETHFVKVQLTLLTANGNKDIFLEATHLFTSTEEEKEEVWNFPLLLDSDEELCVENGFLVLLCEFACSGENITSYSNVPLAQNSTKFDKIIDVSRTLQEDLYSMLCKTNHCDIKLQVADNTIEAHKCILASRSPVFSTMFEQDMLETQTGIVPIADVDETTLKSFLKFLYTDRVDDMNYESAYNLIVISDKYQVIPLKQICGEFLKSQLSTENACEIAKLADLVCHDELKSLAIDFIAVNSKAIFMLPEWIPWVESNMKLATNVFSILTDKVISS